MKVAIIDIGTNTAILLIAQINPDKTYQVIHDECRIVRLGEDIHHNPHFLEQAMERTIMTLKDYKQIMAEHGCEQNVITGTAAFRKATNANEFIKRVEQELGLSIEVIDGDTEANLIYKASIKDFPQLEKPLLVLDIGGGSTEFIFDDGKNITMNSSAFGSVTLTDQFIHTDPPSQSDLAALREHILEQLNQIEDQRRKTKDERRLNLIATAGTPTTLYALNKGLKEYVSKLVHGNQMTKQELTQVMNKLESLSFKERSQLPCLPPKRADVIIAGSNILKTVMDYFNLEDFWVSDRGLRFGILYDRFLS